MDLSTVLAAVLGAAVVCQSSAGAAVLRVAIDEADQKIHVFDGASASSVSVDASNLGIQLGTVTADVSGNKAYFIGNSAGVQSLHQLNYATTQGVAPVALDSALRITHLEWDGSGTARLVGVGIAAADDSVHLISLLNGGVTDLGMPVADCCVFRAGVSAFRSSDDSLYLVGRRAADTQDQLFRFTMNPPALVHVVAIPADVQVAELDLLGGSTLVGLAFSTAAEATKVFTTDAALNLTLLGSGMSDCCFVMAGAAALDSLANQLNTLGPGIAGLQPNPVRQWGFNLSTGAISDGLTATNGAGLFFDTTPILSIPILFADGFEK